MVDMKKILRLRGFAELKKFQTTPPPIHFFKTNNHQIYI